jgi:DNA-binding winged helix-turn-helix (wHTH) protein
MIYTFDAYVLDARLYELRDAGTPLQLEPKGFELLAYVVQHRARIVTKHEPANTCGRPSL